MCSRLNYESASLAAPFIALAAGALLTVACAREALKVHARVNYIKIDLFGYQQAMDIRSKVAKAADKKMNEATLFMDAVD
ncbi:hypothetical protein D3C87_1999070 [compost metagenome]